MTDKQRQLMRQSNRRSRQIEAPVRHVESIEASGKNLQEMSGAGSDSPSSDNRSTRGK